MGSISQHWLKVFIIFSIIYWAWFGLVIENFPGNIFFYVALVAALFLSSVSRKLIIAFSPFLVYLLIYDSLRILHNYEFFKIHNQGLYNAELSLFGISFQGKLMTLCEYFNIIQIPFLDLYAGAFYLTWAPFPILFGLLYFFWNKRSLVFKFWMCFLIANLIGIAVYIIFPAAPPWYYLEFGSEIIRGTGGSAAGLARFDQIVGLPIYHNMYSQSPNTFGALPSMHCAFPVILTFYARKTGNRILTFLFFISMLSIWFAAVYTNHHYVIDVCLGILCAILSIIIMEYTVNRNFAVRFFEKADDLIK